MILLKFSTGILVFFSLIFSEPQDTGFNNLYPILNEYVRNFPAEFRKIPEDRRYRLNEIVYFLEEQSANHDPMQLLFIGSNQASIGQMAQVWSKTAAYYFGFSNFQAYSGGLQTGEISVNTITSLEKSGFIVYKNDIDGIDVYRIKYSYNLKPIVAFTKKIEHVKNPYNNFMAVVLDQNADINIQNIKGTYNRLFLAYEDPVGYEGSDVEDQMYDESCRRVAVEMFYVFSQLRRRLKEN